MAIKGAKLVNIQHGPAGHFPLSPVSTVHIESPQLSPSMVTRKQTELAEEKEPRDVTGVTQTSHLHEGDQSGLTLREKLNIVSPADS